MNQLFKFKLLIVLLFVFALSGCARLESVDKKLGEMFFNASSTDGIVQSGFGNSSDERINPKDLTKGQKDKINIWLEENKKNRYGDPPSTYYTGGTPLLDESGGRIERYEYILNNHPEIFNN